MNLFRLDASIRIDGSVSRGVADSVEAAWRGDQPHPAVLRRDLGAAPLPAGAWADAVTGGHLPAEQRTAPQTEALALAAELADEVLAADAYLLAVPLYNFGVPQHVKTWVDLLMTDPRLRPGSGQPLAGRPAALVVVRGGGYGPGTPREGWDHGTPWLRRIFGDVFGLDLHEVEAELTLAEVNPAMEALRGQAAQSLRDAHSTAQDHGRTLADRVRTPVG
ncbi:FMN-dependent NADH-azoreductase [Catellatospora sp. TT07R-123]|uniref:FMN-dependent NADH-azoreductase n=1 Tax=Catellatospora sp. TT07R-123 TaxID=2733863 RepID=UPI001B138680|nr:NAD(P)H-dependent oxidoreductase [Catellatospora sp. TT07R-123]GHJ44062.1 FMN-dependent NADH-azoreductase [Catellatospora sp. TT07R-123]